MVLLEEPTGHVRGLLASDKVASKVAGVVSASKHLISAPLVQSLLTAAATAKAAYLPSAATAQLDGFVAGVAAIDVNAQADALVTALDARVDGALGTVAAAKTNVETTVTSVATIVTDIATTASARPPHW